MILNSGDTLLIVVMAWHATFIVKRLGLGLGLGLGIENRESRIETVPVLTVKCPGPPTHP